MARKPRQPCLKCSKKRCSELNTFCKPCELQVRIDSIDVAAEREKIIAHYEQHYASKYSHGKFVGRLNKPKYKLFVLKKDVGKCGGERWFFRGDVSLGYPQWAKELKKIGGKYGKYERVDVIEVRTYGWRYYDVNRDGPGMWKYYEFGEIGRFSVGPCAIPVDAVIWLEEPYEKLVKEALQKKRNNNG